MVNNKKDDIEKILGYEIAQKEAKKYIVDNPDVREQVENWLVENMGRSHLKGIRRCNLHLLDYDIDISELDEYELTEFKTKSKHNEKICPGHKTCPIYLSGLITPDEKCVLELVDTQFLIKGLADELEVEAEDFNDQILIGQLVMMNLVYNRAMEGLAHSGLIDEIKTYQKGTTKIEKKTNEYFPIAERCLQQMDKLRKSLVLNRDDKFKIKMVKKANSVAESKKRVEEKIKEIENETTVSQDLISEIMADGTGQFKKVSQSELKELVGGNESTIADEEIIDL